MRTYDVCYDFNRGIVKILRFDNRFPVGEWVTKRISALRVMHYLYTHHALYQYYSREEHTIVYVVEKR